MKNRILVIGAGSRSKKDPLIKGIGTCIVERLAEEGNLSILFSYNKSEEGAIELLKKFRAKPPPLEINCFQFDSSKYLSEWEVLESELFKFGTPNIFIYNSGLRYYKKNLTKLEKEATMNVNYSCPVFLIKNIGEKMIEEGIKGKIIIIGSILAGKHHPFLEDYCITKGLMDEYIKENKSYWKKKGIEIQIISPDVTKTPMTEDRIPLYENEVRQGNRSKIDTPESIAEEVSQICFRF